MGIWGPGYRVRWFQYTAVMRNEFRLRSHARVFPSPVHRLQRWMHWHSDRSDAGVVAKVCGVQKRVVSYWIKNRMKYIDTAFRHEVSCRVTCSYLLQVTVKVLTPTIYIYEILIWLWIMRLWISERHHVGCTIRNVMVMWLHTKRKGKFS